MSTHLSHKYPDKIQLIIADRTFGSLKDISLRKFEGFGTSFLFDLITLKWEAHNDENFLNVSSSGLTHYRRDASRSRPATTVMMS